jgi:hypothetical protein
MNDVDWSSRLRTERKVTLFCFVAVKYLDSTAELMTPADDVCVFTHVLC